jgi:hypothetical protein
MPYQRALKCLTAYEELRMKCTHEYLSWHVKAVENALRGSEGKGSVVVNLNELSTLNNNLKQRLEQWVIDLNLAYRLASIVFFDKTENPVDYDFKYGNEKIEHWKKHNTMDVFFSKVPIQRLLPFLKDLEMNLEIYSVVVEQLKDMQRKDILRNLSEAQKKTFTASQSLTSAGVMQQNQS